MLDVHLFGTIFVTRAAWPHFVAAGYGRVVNTASEAMLGGIPELTSYAAAKGALHPDSAIASGVAPTFRPVPTCASMTSI